MGKSKITIGVVTILVVVALVSCVLLLGKDKTGPVITIPSNIVYRSGMTNKELLRGVTAVDNKDGDVSDTLIVKSVIELSKGNNVKITYAAQDGHNNITEKSIMLSFEKEAVVEKPTEDETETGEPSSDNSSSSDEQNNTPPETTTDYQEEPTPVETVSPDAPVLTLITYNTEIVKGSEVNWLQFVSDITDDKDSRSDLFTRIMINDYPDINTPGEYNMKFTCSDSDGNVSPVAVLTVKIIE